MSLKLINDYFISKNKNIKKVNLDNPNIKK